MPYTVCINGYNVVCDSYESLQALIHKPQESNKIPVNETPQEPTVEPIRFMRLTDLVFKVLEDRRGSFLTTEEVSFIIKRKYHDKYPQPIKERSVSGILSSLKSRNLITSTVSGYRMVYGINKD